MKVTQEHLLAAVKRTAAVLGGYFEEKKPQDVIPNAVLFGWVDGDSPDGLSSKLTTLPANLVGKADGGSIALAVELGLKLDIGDFAIAIAESWQLKSEVGMTEELQRRIDANGGSIMGLPETTESVVIGTFAKGMFCIGSVEIKEGRTLGELRILTDEASTTIGRMIPQFCRPK